MPTTTERFHLQSAADLLKAEKANQREAKREIDREANRGSERDAEKRIAAAMLAFLLLRHSRTAAVSLKALRRELRAAAKAARFTYPNTLDLTGLDAVSRADRAFARRAAASYAKRWKSLFDEAKAGGKASPRRAATRAAQRRLDSTVATDTARSFSAVRQPAIARIGEELDDTPEFIDRDMVVARKWYAELDACPVCTDYDGEIVAADDTFPEEPGGVHPNCRCIDVLVVVHRDEL